MATEMSKRVLRLPNDPSAHDERLSSIRFVWSNHSRHFLFLEAEIVDGFPHHLGVGQPLLARHGIGASGVDHHRSNAFSSRQFQSLLAHLYRCGFELVHGEDGGGSTWCVRHDEGDVRRAGVGWFYSGECPGCGEPSRIGPRAGYILLLGIWNLPRHWCRVLTFRYAVGIEAALRPETVQLVGCG